MKKERIVYVEIIDGSLKTKGSIPLKDVNVLYSLHKQSGIELLVEKLNEEINSYSKNKITFLRKK